jgi:hypothetical protein
VRPCAYTLQAGSPTQCQVACAHAVAANDAIKSRSRAQRPQRGTNGTMASPKHRTTAARRQRRRHYAMAHATTSVPRQLGPALR